MDCPTSLSPSPSDSLCTELSLFSPDDSLDADFDHFEDFFLMNGDDEVLSYDMSDEHAVSSSACSSPDIFSSDHLLPTEKPCPATSSLGKKRPLKKASQKKFRPSPAGSPAVRRSRGRSLPAIPSDDIRRRLAALFVNAVNGGDLQELLRLLCSHCAPDVSLLQQRCERVAAGEQLEVRGLEAVQVFVAAMMSAVPDGVVQLRTTKVCPHPENCCSITCCVTFSGCKVVDLVGDEGSAIVVAAPPALRSDPLGDGVLAYTVKPGSGELVPDRLPAERLALALRAQPVSSKGMGRVTLLVDSDLRISKIHILHSCCVK